MGNPRRALGSSGSSTRRDSQSKQRLLQSGAANDDIPEGVAEGLHFYMENRLEKLGFAGVLQNDEMEEDRFARQRKFE